MGYSLRVCKESDTTEQLNHKQKTMALMPCRVSPTHQEAVCDCYLREIKDAVFALRKL